MLLPVSDASDDGLVLPEGSDDDECFPMMQVEEDAFVDHGPRPSSGAAPDDAFLVGESDDGERWELGGRQVATSIKERRPRPEQAWAKRQLPQERLLPMNGQLFDEGSRRVSSAQCQFACL